MCHLKDDEILKYVDIMEHERDVDKNPLKLLVEEHIAECDKCRQRLESFEKKMFFAYRYSSKIIDELSEDIVEDEEFEDFFNYKKLAQEAADEYIEQNDMEKAILHLKDYFEWIEFEDGIHSKVYADAYKKYSQESFFKQHLEGDIKKPPVIALIENLKNRIIKVTKVGNDIITSIECASNRLNANRLIFGALRSRTSEREKKDFNLSVQDGRTLIETDCNADVVDFDLVLVDDVDKKEYKGELLEGEKAVFDFGHLPENRNYRIEIVQDDR
mgnify:CR=1 FL=1